MAKRYTVSDGRLVLTLEEAEEGGYVVTSPMEPGLITEAEAVSDAFDMARDALDTIRSSRSERGGRRAQRRRRGPRKPAKRFNVNDGRLMLTLEPMARGVFLVRSPMDPEILASARSIEEAFEKAYSVQKSLIASRRDWAKRQRVRAAG